MNSGPKIKNSSLFSSPPICGAIFHPSRFLIQDSWFCSLLAFLAVQIPECKNWNNLWNLCNLRFPDSRNPLRLRVLVVHQKKIYFPLDKQRFVWYTLSGVCPARSLIFLPSNSMPGTKNSKYTAFCGTKSGANRITTVHYWPYGIAATGNYAVHCTA